MIDGVVTMKITHIIFSIYSYSSVVKCDGEYNDIPSLVYHII